jgi:hypothetical protein
MLCGIGGLAGVVGGGRGGRFGVVISKSWHSNKRLSAAWRARVENASTVSVHGGVGQRVLVGWRGPFMKVLLREVSTALISSEG